MNKEKVLRKVRHWDMWMNGEDVLVKGAPYLYMASSSDPALLSGSGPEIPWGYSAMERRISFSDRMNRRERERFFKDFCLLKERRHLYHIQKKAIEPNHSSPELTLVQGFFKLPSNMIPGSYDVTLSVVLDGQMISRKAVPIRAVMVGIPSLIDSLAEKHSLLYGCTCVFIALLAGLFVGLIFERLGIGKRRESQ